MMPLGLIIFCYLIKLLSQTHTKKNLFYYFASDPIGSHGFITTGFLSNISKTFLVRYFLSTTISSIVIVDPCVELNSAIDAVDVPILPMA